MLITLFIMIHDTIKVYKGIFCIRSRSFQPPLQWFGVRFFRSDVSSAFGSFPCPPPLVSFSGRSTAASPEKAVSPFPSSFLPLLRQRVLALGTCSFRLQLGSMAGELIRALSLARAHTISAPSPLPHGNYQRRKVEEREALLLVASRIMQCAYQFAGRWSGLVRQKN